MFLKRIRTICISVSSFEIADLERLTSKYQPFRREDFPRENVHLNGETILAVHSFHSPAPLLRIMVLKLNKLLTLRMHALNRTESLPIHGKNILLVIAHPDDEVMFFGPTLIGITNSSAENSVRVLCLSNGASLLPGRG